MATFVSKRRELRLIVKPADRTFDEARRPVILRGERVEFNNYRFYTDDADLIAWLRQHPLFGREFTSADSAPIPPKPPADVQMIRGPRTTVGTSRPEDSTLVAEGARIETPITKDEIEILIDQKMDNFMERMMGVMQSQAAAKDIAKAPKRTFTCPVPGCGQVFKSGIEVGKHKKLAHLTSA